MLFYDCATAPSPRRVRIFLAEKGIRVPTVQVDLRNGAHLQAEFARINPECTVPALVLDNGTTLIDTVAICVYFEALHAEPALIGRTPEEKGVIVDAHRRAERDGLHAAMEAFRNATPGLKDRAITGPVNYEQIPALAERGKARLLHFYAAMDRRLGAQEYVAGKAYSMADITVQIAVELAKWARVPVPEDCKHLRRWFDAVSARPSAKA